MKPLLLSLCLLLTINAFAQEPTFALDERGKYIYYELVEAQNAGTDSLLKKASIFVDVKYKRTFKNKKIEAGILKAEGKSVLDKTVLVASRPIGEILYNFQFEVKAGKYRFWLTDFLFIPYQRDRYGNYVPATTIGTPLEKSPGKLNAGEWRAIVAASFDKSTSIAKDLKDFMSKKTSTVQDKKTQKVISTNKW